MKKRFDIPSLVSLVLSVLMLGMALFVLGTYYGVFPWLAGLDPLRWALATILSFLSLWKFVYTWSGIAIVLGAWGWWRVTREPQIYRCRRMGEWGVRLSVAVVLVTLVGQAMLRDFLRVPNSDGVDGVGGHELAMDDVGQVMRLETACEAFAEAHDDRYPETLDALFRWWEVDRGRAMPVTAGEFVYVGAGLRRLAREELNGPEAHPLRMPIVFVRKEPLEDGRRWIGVVRYSRTTGATHLLEPGDFEQYLVVNDEVRARRGLGAVAEEIRRSIRGTSAGAADAH